VQAWEERLKGLGRPRVGLAWSGNAQHDNDRNRSVPLETILRFIVPEATFISLQKELRPDDATVLAGRSEIVDLTADLGDLAETAALISCLDLVVTVDASVVHLASALGCPTWILLPFVPDFRWLLDRDDSPWYPTPRLFRQTGHGDYADVVERVRDALAAWASAYKH
jgi:Glycosyltransferase family 9 (heptosyltransferase)